MPLFPLFADLSGREVLRVGGGEVATRKLEALLQARRRCRSTPMRSTLRCRSGWRSPAAAPRGRFRPGLAGRGLAGRGRHRRRRLANIVDDAELSTFQVPAIVDRARGESGSASSEVPVAAGHGSALPDARRHANANRNDVNTVTNFALCRALKGRNTGQSGRGVDKRRGLSRPWHTCAQTHGFGGDTICRG